MFQLLVAGLTVGSGYALVALGIHIILRATRIVNFAQGEFTIIGGLLISQLLTLYTTPVIYIWFDRLATRLSRHRKTGQVPAVTEPVPAR